MKSIVFIIAFTLSLCNEVYHNKLLFCLKSSIDPLIIKNHNQVKSNIGSIDNILKKYKIISLEPWLTGATKSDFDKDIYLNRIYRITTKNRNYNQPNNSSHRPGPHSVDTMTLHHK